MSITVPRTDVLVKLLGGPHRTEVVTSALRLTQALLEHGATVQVWACGDATSLTCATRGDRKPRNVVNWSYDYPSTPTLVRELLTAHEASVHWFVCRFCCEDRGTTQQIPDVSTRSPSRFWEHVRAADKLVALGAG